MQLRHCVQYSDNIQPGSPRKFRYTQYKQQKPTPKPLELGCPRGSLQNSTVVFWLAQDELSSRHDRLLLGKQRGKDICCLLPVLEVLVGVEDQRLDEVG